jgi:hypothetical protein
VNQTGIELVSSKQHLRMCIFLNLLGIAFLFAGKMEGGIAMLYAGLCKFECYGITKAYEESNQ